MAEPDHQPDPNDPVVDRILDIVAKETNVPRERLQPEARIDDLGIASIDMVHAIFALESEFDVEIPVLSSQSGNEFSHVGELVGHVMATLKTARADQGA